MSPAYTCAARVQPHQLQGCSTFLLWPGRSRPHHSPAYKSSKMLRRFFLHRISNRLNSLIYINIPPIYRYTFLRTRKVRRVIEASCPAGPANIRILHIYAHAYIYLWRTWQAVSVLPLNAPLPNTQTEQTQHLFIIYIPIQDEN